MTDHLSSENRSKNMAAIKAKNTSPEIKVRRLLFSKGIRFRLHTKNLPGKPDITIKKYKTAIFVHGCFWHSHKGCNRSNIPKSNQEYWIKKISKNVERDEKNKFSLLEQGWKVFIIWECETKNQEKLSDKLDIIISQFYKNTVPMEI